MLRHDKTIAVPLDTPLYKALKAAAVDDETTISHIVRRQLRQGLSGRFFDPDDALSAKLVEWDENG